MSEIYIRNVQEQEINSFANEFNSKHKENSISFCQYEPSIDGSSGRSLLSATSSYHYYGSDGHKYWHKSNGTNVACSTSISSPHLGDGNRRRFDGSPWIPYYVKISFTQNISSNKNRSRLDFIFSGSNINNLNQDSNEAIEMEICYYWRYQASEGENRGYAFQYNQNSTWSSNQPKSYLDTALGDSYGSVSLCVGCADTTLMSAYTQYYWYIDSLKGPDTATYPHDGRFKVVAQRSYRVGGYTAYDVFAEEHERQVNIGVPAGINPNGDEYHWVQEPYNAYYCISNGGHWLWNGSDYHIYNEDES